ncbi:hypothetical protein [Verrucosispora sioxanthis]|uniref:hypothetical protein n=1 Tax=Verrucosispora sioxanthis TaxID=2499994 RepID=UPI0040392F29
MAEAVGVSRSTVSNAYGRPDQLSPQLRQRILETARQMGYPGPDPTARSLRRGFVGAIGVLFTSRLSYAFTDPFAVRFLTGVAEAAERHGSNLLLIPLPDDAVGARTAVENAAVDGFCVYCAGDEEGILDTIRGRGLPFVTTSSRPRADDLWVGIDERSAARSAAAHLATLGHRKVALLGHDVLPLRRARPRCPRRPACRRRVGAGRLGYRLRRHRRGHPGRPDHHPPTRRGEGPKRRHAAARPARGRRRGPDPAAHHTRRPEQLRTGSEELSMEQSTGFVMAVDAVTRHVMSARPDAPVRPDVPRPERLVVTRRLAAGALRSPPACGCTTATCCTTASASAECPRCGAPTTRSWAGRSR